MSEWASNGFKPKSIVLFETESHYANKKDYLCYHRQLQEFISSPRHAASLSWFCRSRGPLGLTIEAPFLQVSIAPNSSSPIDAGIATLPAHAGQFVLHLGRSLQGDLTARGVKQQPRMIPNGLSVPFSQCAPVLSCIDFSFLTLPARALSCPQR